MIRTCTRAVLILALASGWTLAQGEPKAPGVFGVTFAQSGNDTVVARVAEGGPAAKAGLKAGDIVQKVGDREIFSPLQARGLLYAVPPKGGVKLAIDRGGEDLSLSMVAGTFESMRKSYAWLEAKIGAPAPEWFAESWTLPEEWEAPPTFAGLKGRVTVILAYQAFCPSCFTHALPVHAALEKHFEASDDIVFLGAHTVFEGFDHNTPAAAVEKARKAGFQGPIFEDARMDACTWTELIRTSGIRATPWTIVIDAQGRLAISEATPSEAKLRERLQKLVQDATPKK